MVLYQFTVPGHVYRKLRIKNWSVKSLGWKKGSRLGLCFRVVDDVPGTKGMDLWKQMSSSKCSFTGICGIFLPLNPSTTTVYARPAFYPSLRFTLSLQSAFYTQCAFYPWSAVCSLQSAVCVLHWPIEIYTIPLQCSPQRRVLKRNSTDCTHNVSDVCQHHIWQQLLLKLKHDQAWSDSGQAWISTVRAG